MEIERDESPELAELAAALAKAQGQMSVAAKGDEAVVKSEKAHYTFRYASLAAVWTACRKPLSDNGLAVMQRVKVGPDGVTVTTQMIHASGQWVKDRMWLPIAQRTPQAIGSAITYARRYSLSSLVGVVSDEDDDGAAAAGGHRPVQHQARQDFRQASNNPPANSRTAEVKARMQGNPNPRVPVLEFGQKKGTKLADLSTEELSAAMDLARERLEAQPEAPWARGVRANLGEIEDEVGRRMDELNEPGAEG